MDFFLSLIKNKILLMVLYPALVLLVGWGSYSWYKISRLESRTEELTKTNSSLTEKLAKHEKVSEDSLKIIELVEEQCRRLIENAKTNPQTNPGADDDSDLDEHIRRLLGQANPRGTIEPPGTRSSP